MLLLIILIILVNNNALVYSIKENIIVTDQINHDSLNYIPCQEITDIQGNPLLIAADDFYISPDIIINSNECNTYDGIKLSFAVVRTKQDKDPDSITVTIYDDDNDKPGNSIFSKTFLSPEGGWVTPSPDPSLPLISIQSPPEILDIIINEGDSSDHDTTTTFSLSNFIGSQQLPERYWISLYVTMPRDFQSTGLKENRLYWLTSTSSSSIIRESKNYHFKDPSNLLRESWINWENANVIEPILNIESLNSNLAWSLSIICDTTGDSVDHEQPPIPINPTPVPTPTGVLPPPLPPLTPTPEPTPLINNNNTNNNTNTTEGVGDHGDLNTSHVLGIIFSILIVIIIIVVILILYVRRKRNRSDRSIGDYIDQRSRDDINQDWTGSFTKIGSSSDDKNKTRTRTLSNGTSSTVENPKKLKGWLKQEDTMLDIDLTHSNSDSGDGVVNLLMDVSSRIFYSESSGGEDSRETKEKDD